MRVCRICGAEKGLDDFYKHPGMKEGVDTKCKECQKNISRTTRSNNLEYYREYDRNRNVLEKRVSAVNAYKKQKMEK